MCFDTSDAEYTCAVWEITTGVSPIPCRCAECSERIPAYGWRCHIYSQEHEQCQRCEDEGSDSYRCPDIGKLEAEELLRSIVDAFPQRKMMLPYIARAKKLLMPEPCKDGDHDYGEVGTYNRCENCHKILLVIAEHEAKEGCPVDERQPLTGQLQEELYNNLDGRLYAAMAIERFPELGAVPWLANLLSESI